MTRRGARAMLALAALLFNTVPARASLTHEGQAWFQGIARVSLPQRFKLWLEVQPRVDGDGVTQVVLRPAIGYQVVPSWTLYQGYAWIPSFDPFNDENRSYQESLLESAPGELRVINRTRFEQRFIEGVDGVSLRLRHMLRFTYPIDDARTWLAAISDELFVNCNDATGGPQAGFDQNRVYLGVRRQLAPGTTLEIGYLHQFLYKPSNDDVSRSNAVVSLDMAF